MYVWFWQVVEYTYRDFVRTWYQRLSDDDQFHFEVCKALQRVIIAFSERSATIVSVTRVIFLVSHYLVAETESAWLTLINIEQSYFNLLI